MDWQERSRRLIGGESIDNLGRAHVILFGLGGVGSFAAEALVRSGIGELSLVEYDTLTATNRNRQIPALSGNEGSPKIDVAAARLRDINPELKLNLYPVRMTGDNLGDILSGEDNQPGFIADAVDDIPAKISLIAASRERGIPLVSSMGAGYRLDPSKLRIGDIGETHTCPLARKLRRELREAGINEGVTVVWSEEVPAVNRSGEAAPSAPASMIFVPAAAGILMASYIVRKLANLL